MTVEAAARSLSERLRDHPGCTSIGIGPLDGQPAIMLMAKTRMAVREWREQLTEWGGYPVVVRYTGPMRLCGAEDS